MTSYSTNNGIIEHVSEAIFNVMDITDGLDGEAAKTYARAAVTAAFTQARDNVSRDMILAARRVKHLRVPKRAAEEIMFAAMVDVLLSGLGEHHE